MKPLTSSLMIVALIGVAAGSIVWAVNLEPRLQPPALFGCLMGTVFGLSALTLKSRVPLAEGVVGVRNLLLVQATTLGLRLVAILLGALAMQRRGFEPFAYVLSFFACYLVQQAVEMRLVLRRSEEAKNQSDTPKS